MNVIPINPTIGSHQLVLASNPTILARERGNMSLQTFNLVVGMYL